MAENSANSISRRSGEWIMVKYVVLKGQIGTMKKENKVNDQIVAMNVTDLIKRLHKGEMSVIASRPAGGTTTLACLIAANAIQHTPDTAVLYFSLEMPTKQLCERIRSLAGENAIQSENLVIDDTAAIDVDEICQRVKSLKAKKNIKLVIVDYVQLVNCRKHHLEGRNAEIARIYEMLRGLALNEDIEVVVFVRMNRARTSEAPFLDRNATNSTSRQSDN